LRGGGLILAGEKIFMRLLICAGVLAIAAPAFAQSAAPAPASESRPVKADAKTGDAKKDDGQKDGKTMDVAPTQDPSITNYDVNGSSAADAMGGPTH